MVCYLVFACQTSKKLLRFGLLGDQYSNLQLKLTQSLEGSDGDKQQINRVCFEKKIFSSSDKTRGDDSYEFFFPSGYMSNLAYIGAKNLNF